VTAANSQQPTAIADCGDTSNRHISSPTTAKAERESVTQEHSTINNQSKDAATGIADSINQRVWREFPKEEGATW
jgi:hypothetical protein